MILHEFLGDFIMEKGAECMKRVSSLKSIRSSQKQ